MIWPPGNELNPKLQELLEITVEHGFKWPEIEVWIVSPFAYESALALADQKRQHDLEAEKIPTRIGNR